ncbi:unnamed protein product [Parascedosporium putredinis]|uniref:V-type proton ATPase subunit H n=1 Tax=Parascedosporium putredinis TaxID=1442378 RepID=A0A9P1H708_9PEZI|nr:unnamed protein product [Parascedosporium putredinis]CAI7999286.1 unnamed protein product [Parascedosporium putredinis]
MALEAPTYLASLQNNIRQRPIPWEGAVRSGLVTDGQLALIRAIDRAKKIEEKKATIENDLASYTALFAGNRADSRASVFETAAKQPAMVQYLLVLLGDIVEYAPSLAKSLLRSDDPYHPFRPLIGNSKTLDDPIPLLTAKVLTSLMASARDESTATQRALPEVLTYLSGLITSNDASKQDIAVQQFSTVLYSYKTRRQFWEQRDETVKPLTDILRAAAGVGSQNTSSLWSGSANIRSGADSQLSGGVGLQLLYHVLLVLWQLSFEASKVGDALDDEYDIVILYTQLLRVSPKEKTSRLIIATLWNLLEKNQTSLLPTAVLARLPSLLDNLSGRHFTDPDLLEDLALLQELLEEYTQTKTTFDEYVAEVNSGHLRWSPPHRNAMFWAENARKILEHENGVLPKLMEIMAKPWDQDKAVLAIACSDIGWLVREAPERRHQLEKLGLKKRVMELMAEADENVRWESLRALGGWLKYSFESSK